tara:strand:- start:3851 stop:4912 length:1062 start_codon:yes stop_codon:yes gene_type:complete
MKKYSMKIEIWGTYPPPIGGVSIHIMRLVHRLQENNLNVVVKDFNGLNTKKLDYVLPIKNKFIEFFKIPFRKKTIIHLHSSNFAALLLLFFLGKRHVIGLTVHNKRLIDLKNPLKRKLFSLFLRRLDFILLNDSAYKEQFINFFNLKTEKIYLCPAYIRPLEIERMPLSDKTLQFRKDKEFLISANAFMLKLENGLDLYGLDLLIELIAAMKKIEIDVGLIFCLPQVGNKSYYKEMLQLINKNGLEGDILILQGNIPNAFQIWEISDLFIRPTTTDIEGVSVKEALDFGTKVITSDVCIRPKQAILFKNRNFDDLYSKTIKVYRASKSQDAVQVNFTELDAVPLIIKLYKSFF